MMTFLHCRGFKALKQIVKLKYKLGQTDEMLAAYRYTLEPCWQGMLSIMTRGERNRFRSS